MNTEWLWMLLPSALALGGLLLWRLRQRRRRPAARAQASQAVQAAQTARASAAAAPQVAPSAIEAQRLAATEALRQARLRKAEQAARLQQRQADVRASVAAPAAPAVPAVVVHVPPPPAVPAAPVKSIARATPIAPSAVTAPAERSRVAAARAAKPRTAPTVLLVDDSKLVRVKTGRLLQHQGWQVLLAEDGLAAWSQLEATVIDLLITDVEMPGLDGFELTRRLRADPRWRALPVIMISGSDDRHQAAARAAGVDLLLGKPYAEAALLAQAQRLIGRSVAPAETSLALH